MWNGARSDLVNYLGKLESNLGPALFLPLLLWPPSLGGTEQLFSAERNELWSYFYWHNCIILSYLTWEVWRGGLHYLILFLNRASSPHIPTHTHISLTWPRFSARKNLDLEPGSECTTHSDLESVFFPHFHMCIIFRLKLMQIHAQEMITQRCSTWAEKGKLQSGETGMCLALVSLSCLVFVSVYVL